MSEDKIELRNVHFEIHVVVNESTSDWVCPKSRKYADFSVPESMLSKALLADAIMDMVKIATEQYPAEKEKYRLEQEKEAKEKQEPAT